MEHFSTALLAQHALIIARPARDLNSPVLHARTITSLWVASAFVTVPLMRLAGATHVQLRLFTTVLKMFASHVLLTVPSASMKQVVEVVHHSISS